MKVPAVAATPGLPRVIVALLVVAEVAVKVIEVALSEYELLE